MSTAPEKLTDQPRVVVHLGRDDSRLMRELRYILEKRKEGAVTQSDILRTALRALAEAEGIPLDLISDSSFAPL